MKLSITCTYCNHKVEKEYYGIRLAETDKCEKCRDKNLIVTEVAKAKLDTYAGTTKYKEEDQTVDLDYDDLL